MRRSGWLLVAVFVVVSSMLMWACGGDKEEETGGGTEPAATSQADKTPEAGKTPEAEKTPEEGEDGGDGGPFAELAGQFKDATFKVTYKVSSTAAVQGIEGTMTWYKKGDNLRIDIDSEIEGEAMTATLITGPEQSYFCSQIPGVAEGGSCFSSPGGADQGVGEIVSGLEETLSDPDVDIVNTDSREIAGEDANCFTVRSGGAEGESQLCLTDEGVPLYSKVTLEDGEMVLEATDFGRDVSDGDFEPPYPVSEGIPGLSDQGQ